jgi:hypothetical protein
MKRERKKKKNEKRTNNKKEKRRGRGFYDLLDLLDRNPFC